MTGYGVIKYFKNKPDSFNAFDDPWARFHLRAEPRVSVSG